MAVEYLIGRLKHLLIDDVVVAPLFSDEVGKLDRHLRRFKALPKQLRDDDEKLKQLINWIRWAVYEAENAIDDAYFDTQNNPLDDPCQVPRVGYAVEEIGDLLEIGDPQLSTNGRRANTEFEFQIREKTCCQVLNK